MRGDFNLLSNLLLNTEGQIKVLDMGLARIGSALEQDVSAQLTTTGQVMGTVEYMSTIFLNRRLTESSSGDPEVGQFVECGIGSKPIAVVEYYCGP